MRAVTRFLLSLLADKYLLGRVLLGVGTMILISQSHGCEAVATPFFF